MLPVRLTVKNFLSYGNSPQTLDFAQVSLACLCGVNGVGKSSILEAITWALWGRARGASDNELIRIGETEMEVDFEFIVSDIHYRVIRRRAKKTRGGISSVEFQVKSSNEFITISEPTIKATQEKIIKILGMQYETFVNSAYLRQGQADEFTVKRPHERKEVLSEILGLSYFDDLETLAREKLKLFTTEQQNIGFVIGNLEEEVKKKSELVMRCEEVKTNVKAAGKAVNEKEKIVSDLREKEKTLALHRSRMQEAESSLKSLNQEINYLEKQKQDLQKDFLELEKLIKQSDKIEHEYKLYKEAKESLDRIDNKFMKVIVLQQEREKIEKEYNHLLNDIESQEKLLEGKKEVLKRDLKRASQAKIDLVALEIELEKRVKAKESLEHLQEKIFELKNHIASSESLNKQLEREIETIQQKMQNLSKTAKKCPLCRQSLTKNHLENVRSEFEHEISSRENEIKQNQKQIYETQEGIVDLGRSLTELKKELIRSEKVQTKKGVLEEIIDQAPRLTAELNDIREQFEDLNKKKNEDTRIKSLQEKMKTIDSELLLLAYDKTKHVEQKSKVEKYQYISETKSKLDRAKSAYEVLTRTLSEVESQLTLKNNDLKSKNKEFKSLTSELDAEAKVKKELKLQLEELSVVQQEYQRINSDLAINEKELAMIFDKENTLKAKKSEAERLLKDRSIYEDLSFAFSKKGVQAMLIETAIPEIETEANEILSRMTDNELHLTFEAQRDKKAGEGVIETLDIKIADRLGTRPYELYSGGEAFRINFAIRVALSKLLARRAGVRLQLLIMDEGFGTQDDLGREHLVHAINAIQKDFSKILVITHLQELKDAFPEKISIEKANSGSIIEMI